MRERMGRCVSVGGREILNCSQFSHCAFPQGCKDSFVTTASTENVQPSVPAASSGAVAVTYAPRAPRGPLPSIPSKEPIGLLLLVAYHPPPPSPLLSPPYFTHTCIHTRAHTHSSSSPERGWRWWTVSVPVTPSTLPPSP